MFFKRIVVERAGAGLYLPGYLAYITVIAYGFESLTPF
ncbi:uncharacterized protein METZ01_LOCUS235663 [marine metagenome]|uniref:Uncharacterized protein n=1 Tax=marine metagenome TaxID=408172 RepID=A0A382H6L3_9ZZZZ